ncbi:MAG TPA: GAF domain-containing protein [Terriglobales bacterium]
MPTFKELLTGFEEEARSARSVEFLMGHIAQRLHHDMARYNWVGFYLMEDSIPKVLVLGPYVGSFTPLKRIPLDKGLCGAAATTGRTVVVNNVAQDPRYVGGDMVKSNLVAPILVDKRVVAEIDVESYFANTFPKADQEFLEACAALVGRYMKDS